MVGCENSEQQGHSITPLISPNPPITSPSLYQIHPSPSLHQIPHLSMAKAINRVVIHHADRLHEGVADYRPRKLKAALFSGLC